MRLEKVSTSYKDKHGLLHLSVIEKLMRGGRKGGPNKGQKGKEEESSSSCMEKKDFSHIKCFMYDKHDHYALYMIPKCTLPASLFYLDLGSLHITWLFIMSPKQLSSMYSFIIGLVDQCTT